MPETIKASEQNLNKVFCDDYVFEIPHYQRPYAWTTDEVGELLDDLLFATGREEDVPYFLGSIVLIKGDGPDSKVIDGQQRLTTLTILLGTLRDLAEEPIKSGLDKRVRQPRDELTGVPEKVRLRLRERDQAFFHANIQTDGAIPRLLETTAGPFATDSQQRIIENAAHLYRKLSDLTSGDRDSLSRFIIKQCYLVVVSTSDIGSAYRIFSVMNDRGLNLGPTDILKAQIIGSIEEGRQEYSDKWEDIEQELGRDRFGDLFVHIRMVYAKAKARRNLQDEFRDFVLKNSRSTDFIDNILEPYAEAYESVLGMSDQGTAGDDRTVACLGSLRRLDNYDWVPPAMAFFRANSADSDRRRQFIADLERLAYGLFIRRANINERVNRYAAILQSMEEGEDILQPEGHLQLRAEEKETIVHALNGPVYTLPRVPKPLLLRLDGLLAGAGARYDHSVISIEHVLPQRPKEDSTWFRWFADDEERASWTHRLANLVLLSRRKNSGASNLDFEEKTTRYFTRGGVSPFALTTQVLNEREWTPAVLQRRQDALVARLKWEWRLE